MLRKTSREHNYPLKKRHCRGSFSLPDLYTPSFTGIMTSKLESAMVGQYWTLGRCYHVQAFSSAHHLPGINLFDSQLPSLDPRNSVEDDRS